MEDDKTQNYPRMLLLIKLLANPSQERIRRPPCWKVNLKTQNEDQDEAESEEATAAESIMREMD